MAFLSKLTSILFVSSLFIHAILGGFECEDLGGDVCAFSISSNGKRCLLETSETEDGNVEYQCRTSEVVVEKMAGYIEGEACVKACEVDRHSTGISSDALFEPSFIAKLCSPPCYHSCPNIVDLYLNLAAGEGVCLDELCNNPHRTMLDVLGSAASAAPVSGDGSSSLLARAPSSVSGDDSASLSAVAPSSVSGDDYSISLLAAAPSPK